MDGLGPKSAHHHHHHRQPDRTEPSGLVGLPIRSRAVGRLDPRGGSTDHFEGQAASQPDIADRHRGSSRAGDPGLRRRLVRAGRHALAGLSRATNALR